jgi:hypothetical protein
VYDPITKTFKEVQKKPEGLIKPIIMDSVTHVKSKNLIVKKSMNSENEGYSDEDLGVQGKKGSQTSRNEPTSRMVETNENSNIGSKISTDNSSAKLKQN